METIHGIIKGEEEFIMPTKKCISCGQEKPKTPDYFYYRNKSKGYLSSWCKDCRKKRRDTDKENQQQRARRRAAVRCCPRCGDAELPPGRKVCDTCMVDKRRATKRIDKTNRKRRLKSRTPKWADRKSIQFFYECRPKGCDVDHVIPIAGERVSGLHIAENLQWLPRAENQSKGNKYEN